jgi:RNA polymerase-interacting CarD/CdnL/TRCF family regulator
MAEKVHQYQIQDWIVHRFYGVGQITKVEPRPINGEVVECFKVEVRDGAYWVPTQSSDNPRIRPVASSKTLKYALKELQKVEPITDSDRKVWKQRIEEVKANGELLPVIRLIRDLTRLHTLRKRNQTEDEALGFLIDRLLGEWCASTGEEIERTRPKLQQYLHAGHSQAGESKR